MRPVPSLTLALSALALSTGCAEEALWPVRATIDDGQVLMGSIETPELLLEGGLGTIAIPWEDIGEVVPVEGEELAASGDHVTVWLRNGSELTGRWVDAELAMDLSVGGELVGVDVPVDQLLRLQTQGGEIWPQGVVYRVRTSHGDDFLIDPESTRIALENEMGTFAPFLAECASAQPLEDPTGDWRIELLTGTVLIGPLVDDAITVDLGIGPGEATVPLDMLVSLDRQDWGGVWYEDESTRISDRIMQAIPRPAARQLQPAAAAPVESWDPMEPEMAAMAGERLPETSLEVDGRFQDTGGGLGGMEADNLRGQGAADGWFSNADLATVKHAI